jgi:hypothetical protein
MKALASLWMAALLLTVQTAVSAAPLYKCEIDGALAFQDTPCPPLKAKQKVACADADGFAVYQDTLDAACANAPAGTEKSYDFSNSNHQNTKQKVTKTTAPNKAATRKSTAGKDVFVRAYIKDDGTKVPSYTRSLPGEKPKE